MKRFFALCFPLAALILEILPWGIRMNFAGPDGISWSQYTCWFDLLPFGYGDFGPLLTAVLTCVLLLLLVICGFRERRGLIAAGLAVASAGLLFSLLHTVLFPLTVIGCLIVLCMAGEAVALSFLLKTR